MLDPINSLLHLSCDHKTIHHRRKANHKKSHLKGAYMEDETYYIPNPSGIFIPSKILDRTDISYGAKIMFGLLGYFADENECSPKQSEIALEMNVTTRSIQRYLKELVDANLIFIKYSPKNHHTEYFLTNESNFRTYKKGDHFNGKYYINQSICSV